MEENSFIEKIKRWIGLHGNPLYVENKMREADARSAALLGFIVVAVEVWMLIRYIKKYVLTGICLTVGDFFHYTQGYWKLLAASVFLMAFSLMYLNGRFKGKLAVLNRVNRFVNALYLIYGLRFGFQTSLHDLSKGRMIICFLTMFMWMTVICIVRPYINITMIVGIGLYFVYYINTNAVGPDGNPYRMEEGDLINFITFILIESILELGVYFQRYRDANASYRLQQAAVTDHLTGIPNMNGFTEEARSYARERYMETDHPVYLVFDVANFQTYNDRFGYEGGNSLLKDLGRVMAEHFAGEPYARLSDDYFVALTADPQYMKKIEAVQKDMDRLYESESYVYIKAAAFETKAPDVEPRQAIDHARFAVGLLKHRNDEHFISYSEEMREAYELRQYVLNNIDEAVEKGYIKVYYQPVIWAEDESLCGFEALARWDDPTMGFLSPGKFVPILEESRQIHKLDRCIYESVCKNMRRCMDEGLPVLPTSLNFSRLDFELMDAVQELEDLVEKYGIPRHYLHVEITESALSEDVAGLQEAMARLHEKGYVIWLDDFGSGYSSMNVLKDYNFDLLKIDMEFLNNFDGNEKADTIIKSILNLAKELDMMTLRGEGILTGERLRKAPGLPVRTPHALRRGTEKDRRRRVCGGAAIIMNTVK